MLLQKMSASLNIFNLLNRILNKHVSRFRSLNQQDLRINKVSGDKEKRTQSLILVNENIRKDIKHLWY